MKLLASLFGPLAKFEEQAIEFHADATLAELEMSHGDLSNLLRTALKAQHPGPDLHCWVRDVFDAEVIYELSNSADVSRLYRRSYTVDDAGAVTLGEPVAVVAVTSYVGATEAGASESEEIVTDLVPLIEKAVKKDGTAKIKIMHAGFGSSGYYPADVLQRDGPNVFAEGTHVYLDHPSATEASDRPERSVKDLAGSLTGPAVWEAQGAAGAGLYAPVKFIDSVAPHINAIASISGMSIRAGGTAGTREVDGKKVRSIESINVAHSIDVVTKAGAGGKVLDLIESARNRATQQEPERTDDVDKAEFEATKTALAEAQTKLGALEQWKTDQEQRDQTAKLMREASAVVTEALATMQLPESVRTKVTTELTLNPPLKEGALDKEALTAKAKERATEEYTYVIEAAGLTGRVVGMGGSTSDVDPKAELAALFEANGHSKEVAARMAR